MKFNDTYYLDEQRKGKPVAYLIRSYLDGKPSKEEASKRKKKPISPNRRDKAFWRREFLAAFSDEDLRSEFFAFALTKYFQNRSVTCPGLIKRVSDCAPGTLARAMRHSEIFLEQEHPRWLEFVEDLRGNECASALIRACDAMRRRLQSLETAVERLALSDFGLAETLCYASIYAFKHVLTDASPHAFQHHNMVLHHIVLEKLASSDEASLQLRAMESSLSEHLKPFCRRHPVPARNAQLLQTFEQHVAAQSELLRFQQTELAVFCHDDNYDFDLKESKLILFPCNIASYQQWSRNGQKLAGLDGYWSHRAQQYLAELGLIPEQFGAQESREWNRLAFLKSAAIYLQLVEVYGVGELVTLDKKNCVQVDVLHAVGALNYLAVYFEMAFAQPFREYFLRHGQWQLALSELVIGGLSHGFKDRLPLRVDDIDDLAERIVRVLGAHSELSTRETKAMVKFWSLNRQVLKSDWTFGEKLFERPLLKLGSRVYSFPWTLALQNNNTAVVNHLRGGSGIRRDDKNELREETHRIEERLGGLFETCGFKVRVNHDLPREADEAIGDVDLVCARDGHLFLLELKSTYIRTTLNSAWQHKMNTLRKAGRQLERKCPVLLEQLKSDRKLLAELGLSNVPGETQLHCWIVDTSIEWDHERFSGFLKVSLPEVRIALRNERRFLRAPEEWLSSVGIDGAHHQVQPDQVAAALSNDPEGFDDFSLSSDLYPQGFDAARFAQVIEDEQVWAFLDPEPIEVRNLIFEIPL